MKEIHEKSPPRGGDPLGAVGWSRNVRPDRARHLLISNGLEDFVGVAVGRPSPHAGDLALLVDQVRRG
jgi:hypothetical protein